MDNPIKNIIEKFSGEPVGTLSDEMNAWISAVADVVYTDGKLDFEMFKQTISNFVNLCPKCWRKGQAVFNMVDAIFGVAREVQFNYGVDCFYNDDAIDNFIEKSYEVYWEHILKNAQNE